MRPPELQFRTDGVGGDEEHEKYQYARYHDAAQIDIIVHPRIAHHVYVEGYGLDEVSDFRRGLSQHLQLGRSHGGRAEGGYGLEVFEEHAACYEGDIAVIERYFGLPF